MPAAGLSLAENFQTGAVLRQQPLQRSQRNIPYQSHVPDPPHIANNNKNGAIEMRCGSLPKTLGERVKAALTRRLFPNTNLMRKQLQHALQISQGTMDNLLSGHHAPSGRVLDMLVQFFGGAFLQEVFGGPNVYCIDPRDSLRAAAVRKLVEAQDELRRLG